MRASSIMATPFEQGKRSGKLRDEARNPYPGGSIEAHNYEVGREFGIRHFKGGIYVSNFEKRGRALQPEEISPGGPRARPMRSPSQR